MSYALNFVNLWQSKKCRKEKYRVLRVFGFNSYAARKFRDWRHDQIAKIASSYFWSIGKDPNEARAILVDEIKPLEDPDLSLYKQKAL